MFWHKMVSSLLSALYWLLGVFLSYLQCVIKMFAWLCKDEETARKTWKMDFLKKIAFERRGLILGRARFVLRQNAFKIRCRVILEL